MAGGILIGLLEAFGAGYVSSRWTDVLVFGVLIGVLVILRPGVASFNPAAFLVLGAAICYATVMVATKKLTATYEMPFMKHAPIGPTIALADARAAYSEMKKSRRLGSQALFMYPQGDSNPCLSLERAMS